MIDVSVPVPEPILLTSREAAEFLRISEVHLYRLTKSGEMPAVRMGRLVRYSPAALRDRVKQLQMSQATS